MIIIQDETESTMIGETNSIINDLEKRSSIEDAFKSPNKRKQIKPNRLTNESDGIPQDLTNGHSPSPLEQIKQTEAYCHLCERSFCNKYFLKTHFAKKHGVLNSVVSPSPSSPVSIEQTPPVLIDPKLSEDYCEICQKRFCNKYYLRKHKGECHGIYTDYIKSLQKSANESPVKTQNNRAPFYLPSTGNDVKSDSPPPPPPQQKPMRRCPLCSEEFRNRALLRIHMTNQHGNDTNGVKKKSSNPFSISPSNNLGFLQPYVDTSSPLAHKLVAGQAPPTSYGILHDSYFCAKMADRVVCEICNKQVCNKYFLKTHKAKVHGITTNGTNDHHPPTMVPSIETHLNDYDESTETNESSESYCSLCKKDFASKYLYLFHMQTVHNDTSDLTYQTIMQLMKAAAVAAAAAAATTADQSNSTANEEESDDESDGTVEALKRKRTFSETSNETNKRLHALTETNGGLQPFMIESEDPTFADTFVPCMVYLPVLRRVTKQVKVHLRLKPVLTSETS